MGKSTLSIAIQWAIFCFWGLPERATMIDLFILKFKSHVVIRRREEQLDGI